MSLFKQLLNLIAVIFLVIFTLNYIISVNIMRSYLEIEAEIHAQNTATSLGLSLAPHMTEEYDPILLTMVNSIFDRGYYKQIRLVSIKGEEWVNVENPTTFEEVPGWFVRLLPIKLATAETEISSGWIIAGTLYITISPGYAYLNLYQQAKQALNYSIIAYVFFNVLAFLLVRFILIPLKKIEKVAKDIAEGNFDTIKQIPRTTEIKNVTLSINFMSDKIKKVIQNLNEKLDKTGQELQLDALTKLKNKNCFERDIKNKLTTHSEGYVFFIRIDNLGVFSKDKGREKVDHFLQEFAGVLNKSIEGINYDISVYRFFGSEFAMLAESMPKQDTENLGKKLSSQLSELGMKYEKPDLVHIGIVPFDIGSSTADILSAASEAYEKAHLIGYNAYVIYRNDEKTRNVEEWKSLVRRVVAKESYKVTFVGKVLNLQNEKEIVMEEIFAEILDGNDVVPIGAFISIAEKYGSIIDVDKGIIQKVIFEINDRNIQHPLSINLSMASVKNAEFLQWLKVLLKANATVLNRLVFAVTAYSASKEMEAFEVFNSFIQNIGVKIMMKRYDSQIITLDQVKKFNLDYIRLARELTTGISKDIGKQHFIEAMKEMGDLLDTKVIAEMVKDPDDYEMLKSIGLYGASR